MPPSHPLHPLTLEPLHPHTDTSHAHTSLTLTPLSLTLSTVTQSPLSSTLSTLSQFSQVWFSYCVIFSCGYVVFVPKLWLIWLFRVLLYLVPKKMRENFIWNFVLRLVFVFVVYLEFQVMGLNYFWFNHEFCCDFFFSTLFIVFLLLGCNWVVGCLLGC